jgi:predicted nucleic acid-binding protein
VKTVVVDASVAAKWFLPPPGETLTTEAEELLQSYVAGELRLLVPDLFWAELANIFWKAVRQGRWTRAAAETAILMLLDRTIPTTPVLALLEDAFAIALTFDRSVYDCLYVSLAIVSKCELVTADERLANALAAHLPVKWLASFQMNRI